MSQLNHVIATAAGVEMAPADPVPAGGLSVSDHRIPGHAREVTLRLYRPAMAPTRGSVPRLAAPRLPTVLYLHGGGFTRGGLDQADPAARHLARHIPALVVSVGYSLAPDHPFPAAAGDAFRAALWARDHAAGFGADGARLGVAGDEAGGHIATSLTFIARDQGQPALRALALVGPMLDPSLTRQSQQAQSDRAGQDADDAIADCARCYRAYLPEAAQRLHPYAAPLESRRLGGLPPALILTARNDLLHVEGERYASRLITAGVPTEVTRFPDVRHADLAGHPPALAAIADFFARRLAP